jgi:hypothetical protein
VSNRLIIGNRNNSSLLEGNFSTGNILIGTSTDSGYKLDVNGTVRILGNLYMNDATNRTIYGINGTYINLYNGGTGGMDFYSLGGNAESRFFGGLRVTGNLITQGSFSMSGNLDIGSNNFVGAVSNGIRLYRGFDASMQFYLGHPTVGDFLWDYPENTTLMVLKRGGNLGIGTTNPTDKLYVQGNSTVTGYLGVHGILYHRSSFAVLNKAAGGWLFWANRNDSEAEVAMRLDYVRSINGTAGGAVGIGTTNPTLGTLHVEGTVYSTRFELPQGADLASGVAGIRVLDPFGGMYQYNNSGGYTGHFTSYHIRNTSAATMFYATSSAFGIGTTSPNARVHIEGGSANWNETTPGTATGTIHLDPGTAGANYGNGITFGAWDWNSGNNAQAGIYVRSDGLYGTKMYFATSNDYTAGSKTRLYIGESGNIGIGTISPSQQLQVTGKVLIGALDNYGDGNTKMYVHNPTSVNIVLNPNPNSADLYYRVKIGVDRSSTGSFYVDHEGARIIEAWNSGVYLNLSSVVSLGNKAWTLETNGYGLQMYSPFGWSSVVRFTNANSGTTSTDGALVGLIEGGTFRVWNYEDQPMLFATNNAERVRIAANGNVGIGANNPTSLLQVGVGQTTTNPLIKLGATYDSSRNVRGAISWDDSANITGKIHTEFDGTMVSMVFGSLYNSGYNSNNLMIIRGNGNIGIGTTSPTYKLDVVGDVRASGDVIALTNLKSMYQVGDEGGEIVLNKPVTGTVIDTSVTIDVFQNKVRIFETGGLNRGGYFDLSALGNSVGTNLARTGWTGTIFIATNPPGQQNITVEGGLITGFGA